MLKLYTGQSSKGLTKITILFLWNSLEITENNKQTKSRIPVKAKFANLERDSLVF